MISTLRYGLLGILSEAYGRSLISYENNLLFWSERTRLNIQPSTFLMDIFSVPYSLFIIAVLHVIYLAVNVILR